MDEEEWSSMIQNSLTIKDFKDVDKNLTWTKRYCSCFHCVQDVIDEAEEECDDDNGSDILTVQSYVTILEALETLSLNLWCNVKYRILWIRKCQYINATILTQTSINDFFKTD